MNFEQARYFMVEQQIRPWDVLDPTILDLIMETPRHEYVEPEYQALAYTDIELPLTDSEKMMAPKVEAKLLQALAIQADEKVLEIGTGSGYVTALMAQLAKEVTTVEIDAHLQQKAIQRLNDFKNINFKTGDASNGWTDNQYYDAILITGALPKVPEAFKEKLSIGGRLAIVTGTAPAMNAQLITRLNDAEWTTEYLFETDIDYLKNSASNNPFVF